MDQESLIERLMAENEEFRRLRGEHRAYDQELETLKGTPPLSADQQWRISELKKLKLMAKDRMETIIRTFDPASPPDERSAVEAVSRPLAPFSEGRRPHGGRFRKTGDGSRGGRPCNPPDEARDTPRDPAGECAEG